MDNKICLGCEVVDIVTGFKGIIDARVEYLYGCNKWSIMPKAGKDGKVGDTYWVDEGRVRYVGPGINKKEVASKSGKGGASLPPSNSKI